MAPYHRADVDLCAHEPVVLDGVVSDEKLSELLALQTEYPELDFKRTIDLTITRDAVELAKDLGAMQVRGGYIVIGVDRHGAPTGELDGADTRPFDEARLTPKMLQYLPSPLVLRRGPACPPRTNRVHASLWAS